MPRYLLRRRTSSSESRLSGASCIGSPARRKAPCSYIVPSVSHDHIIVLPASASCSTKHWLCEPRIVLACAEGRRNAAVAADLRGCADTVGKWRSRFVEQWLDGLLDKPLSGRPPVMVIRPVVSGSSLVRLACSGLRHL